MKTVIKMMWLMTHINIGATLALIAWMVWPHYADMLHNEPSALATPTYDRAAIPSAKELP